VMTALDSALSLAKKSPRMYVSGIRPSDIFTFF
jgi:hypothetical protein